MAYVALYRKYRPQKWEQVYGQQAIVQTLKAQIMQKRIGHAYLFSGGRGTGKTTVAKLFAKAVNCANPVNGNPCEQCDACKATINGYNTDITEIDAASNNGVDDVRTIIEQSKYRPQNGQYRVYIIDEVHMLSKSAFNALLKTLEEPSQGVLFILATTEVNKVPATIYSRCQHYHFRPIPVPEICQALKNICTEEQITVEDEALVYIARLANGGLRDAVSMIDQCISASNGMPITKRMVCNTFGEVEDEVINNIAYCIDNANSTKVFEIVDQQIENGRDIVSICSRLYSLFKDRLMHNQSSPALQRIVKILGDTDEKMRWNKSKTTFEVGILNICTPVQERTKDYAAMTAMMSKLHNLESMLQSLQNGLATIGTPYPAQQQAPAKMQQVSFQCPPVQFIIKRTRIRTQIS